MTLTNNGQYQSRHCAKHTNDIMDTIPESIGHSVRIDLLKVNDSLRIHGELFRGDIKEVDGIISMDIQDFEKATLTNIFQS